MMALSACNLNGNEPQPSNTETDNPTSQEHSHSFLNEWSYDGTYHWHACSGCEEVRDKGEHDWNSGVIITAPTETSEGVKEYACNTCGKTKVDSIPMLNHEHTFELKWTSDDTYHWHAATCGHETEKSGKAEHTWDNGIITKEASETEAGVRTYTCVVCSATKTEEIPVLTHVHTYEEGWTSDDTYHWHASTCGHETEISGKAEHTWDSGVVTKEASETEAGARIYTCVVCSATKTEEIPMLTHVHTYEEGWTSDDTYHWHASACGHETEVSGKAEHTWNNGVVTKDPTETTAGEKTYTCQVCGKTKIEEITPLSHAHTFEKGWTSDDTYHWHASTCGHDVSSEKAQHTWDGGVVTKEASETETGIMTYTCSVCDRTKTETIAVLPHTHIYETKWTYDENYHWHASACGHETEINGKAEHAWDNGVVTKEASETETGIKTYTCSVCGKTKSEVLPKVVHTHTYSNDWSYNDDYHWHPATCEHSSLKKDEGLHDWVDTGVIITVATETVEGEKEQQCSVCGHIRTIKTGKLDHVHTFTDVWSYDDEYHWHSATCGHDVSSEKAQHDWDSGVVTNQATVYDAGIKTYTCSICGATKEESIPELDSFAVVFMDNNNRTISERNYVLGTSGNAIIIPTPISLDGYQFIGWGEITSTINVSLFDFSSAKNNDIYYFKAHYEKLFNIVFKDYQGNELLTITKSESNNNIGIEECPAIPNREGYTSHWDIQTLSNISKDTVITPIYEKITFEVVFKDNVGNVLSYNDSNGNVVKKQIIDYGSFAVAPEYEQYYFNKTEMKMYEFSGWSAPFDSIKENTVIVAQYNKLYEDPVIAVKINGNRVSLSIVLPSKDTTLYSLSLSFKWNVDVGTCSIVDSIIKSSTPLNADTHDGECTVGGKSGWLNYNNKTSTFDFVWNCGHGHSFNNTHFTQDVVTLTFEVDGGASIMESIFTLAENSWIICGESDGNVSDLQKTKPMIWFYE